MVKTLLPRSLKTGIFLEMKYSIKFVFIILFFQLLFSQSDERDYSEELRYQNDAINSLKTEIKQLRSKIKSWTNNPSGSEPFRGAARKNY